MCYINMQLTYPIHKKFVGWAYLPNAGSYPDQSSDLVLNFF